MVVLAVAMVIMYYAIDAIRRGREASFAEERAAEAETLAQDILEVTKYLFFYERAVFTDSRGPLDFSGGRGSAMHDLLKVSLGAGSATSVDLMKTCGGYDAKGRPMGEFKLNGASVICPYYLRSEAFSTDMLEQLVLSPLAVSGWLRESRAGIYELDLVFFDSSAGIDNLTDPSRNFLFFNMGQALLKAADVKVKSVRSRIRIFTSKAGFTASTSERFIQIVSDVELKSPALKFTRQQSFISYPSAPRDFALFLVYPTRSDGVTRTDKWSESVSLPPSAKIEGRVFFNGDIDVPLDRLPTFTETVILTGSLSHPSYATKETRLRLKTKFLKGVMARFSAPRFLMSGACSRSAPTANFVTSNGTNFPCHYGATTVPMQMTHYLANLPVACAAYDAQFKNGEMSYVCPTDPNDPQAATCVANGCDSKKFKTVSGPVTNLTVHNDKGFGVIHAPVAHSVINAHYMFGSLMGGYLHAPNLKVWSSLAAVRPGSPHMGSVETIENYGRHFVLNSEGINIPLPNLPIVYEGRVGQ